MVRAITENTSIRLGLVVALAGALIAGGIAWGSTSAALDAEVKRNAAQEETIKAHSLQLERQQVLIERMDRTLDRVEAALRKDRP